MLSTYPTLSIPNTHLNKTTYLMETSTPHNNPPNPQKITTQDGETSQPQLTPTKLSVLSNTILMA
jgi:hypothetical protein